MERKTIIVTPVRNESWILRDYLTYLSSFADHIIIGDHYSTDGSIEIASSFSKVELVSAKSRDFTEAQRRNQLLIEARKFGENNLIISLDADELLSPNLITDQAIRQMKSFAVGTRFSFPHLNVLPGWKKYWAIPMKSIAFIDDGSLHPIERIIHFPRIPDNDKCENVTLQGGMIHLQYIDWKRMESKHRWYRTWEKINIKGKSQLEIYRRYSHMYNVPSWKLKSVPDSWFESYADLGLDLKSIGSAPSTYWWDSEVEALVRSHSDLDFSLLSLRPDSPLEGLTQKQRSFVRYLRLTWPLERLSWLMPARVALRVIDKTAGRNFK